VYSKYVTRHFSSYLKKITSRLCKDRVLFDSFSSCYNSYTSIAVMGIYLRKEFLVRREKNSFCNCASWRRMHVLRPFIFGPEEVGGANSPSLLDWW